MADILYNGWTPTRQDEIRRRANFALKLLAAEIGEENVEQWIDSKFPDGYTYPELADAALAARDIARGLPSVDRHWSDRPEIDERPH